MLTYADENFDSMLEIGFGDSIRREWAWRVKRGESLANLQAFAHFADPSRSAGAPSPDAASTGDPASSPAAPSSSAAFSSSAAPSSPAASGGDPVVGD